MIQLVEKNKCCGCAACYNICPQKAIIMKEDDKGFVYPQVLNDICINCGMCKLVCPEINPQKVISLKKVYATYNLNDEERLNSSSGGMFVLLAKSIISRGGSVFGAYLNEEMIVKHGYVESEEELRKFMGSKYVQSTIGDTYKKVKEILNLDRYVLFTGTPCQIEGLKSFLREDYEKLYTQDFICHGVPSPLVWKKYLEYRKNKDNEIPREIYFRNKDNGWKQFNLKFVYSQKAYNKNKNKDLFMKAFLSNTILRESCYNCSYKKENRISDITLADFWGIEEIHPEMDDNKGTSMLIINSEKGKQLFELIKNDAKYIESKFENVCKFNPPMTKSAERDVNREAFFNKLNETSFHKAVNKYTYKKPLYIIIFSNVKRCIKKILRYRTR